MINGKENAVLPNDVTITLRPRTLLAGLFLSPLAGGIIWWVLSLPWNSANAPAWVQAVGSVGAVLVAMLVASRHSAQQIRLVREQEAEMLKKVVAIAKHTGNLTMASLDVLENKYGEFAGLDIVSKALDNSDYLLRQVSFDRIPQSEAALGWVELRHAANDVRRAVELAEHAPESFEEQDYHEAAEACQRAVDAVRRIESAATGHLPELVLP
ncbi:hypothetical protein SA496_01095 [Pseudomonas sp. JS3066]|uniref:hypothetical protein n=1 Tax=Pseudomonas sp. JS3066 TaxID=3090665 RepID=UPI002E7AFE85|nr:hypothetical protein [Pseudomonas sp. JS3066]WVK93812.1 hypothetical protein SA496_01095 [Pseudomonas sp. JS3066]